jgi:hypothetical protein
MGNGNLMEIYWSVLVKGKRAQVATTRSAGDARHCRQWDAFWCTRLSPAVATSDQSAGGNA